MPLHDYSCSLCNYVWEAVVKWNEYVIPCPVCGKPSDRIYLQFSGMKHTAPAWLKSVTEVVDKDGGPHCQEFLKHQTRDTYNNWMKGEGIRPMHEGEKIKRNKADTSGIRKKVKEKFRRDNTIHVRG